MFQSTVTAEHILSEKNAMSSMRFDIVNSHIVSQHSTY
jgi:hypothetical protein